MSGLHANGTDIGARVEADNGMECEFLHFDCSKSSAMGQRRAVVEGREIQVDGEAGGKGRGRQAEIMVA